MLAMKSAYSSADSLQASFACLYLVLLCRDWYRLVVLLTALITTFPGTGMRATASLTDLLRALVVNRHTGFMVMPER